MNIKPSKQHEDTFTKVLDIMEDIWKEDTTVMPDEQYRGITNKQVVAVVKYLILAGIITDPDTPNLEEPTIRKVIKFGTGLALSIPAEVKRKMGLKAGDMVEWKIGKLKRSVMIRRVD